MQHPLGLGGTKNTAHPEYSKNNRSSKLTNLLTKFFPAGSDRSHFLLRALSEVLNGKLSSSVRLPDLRRRLSRMLKTTERRPGTYAWNGEEAEREVHSPSLGDLPPLFLFRFFWEAGLWDSRCGWNTNWRNPDATGLKSAPAPAPASPPSTPLLSFFFVFFLPLFSPEHSTRTHRLF